MECTTINYKVKAKPSQWSVDWSSVWGHALIIPPGVLSVGHVVSKHIMTSSNGNIFRVTGHLCGEFTGHLSPVPTQRPVTRSFDVFFDLRLNKRLSKHLWGWWFETPSWSLWRHPNDFWYWGINVETEFLTSDSDSMLCNVSDVHIIKTQRCNISGRLYYQLKRKYLP